MRRESTLNYCHATSEVVKNMLSGLHSTRIVPYCMAFATIERLQ